MLIASVKQRLIAQKKASVKHARYIAWLHRKTLFAAWKRKIHAQAAAQRRRGRGVTIKAPKGIAPVDPIVLGGRGRGVTIKAPKGIAPVDPIVLGGRGRGVTIKAPKGIAPVDPIVLGGRGRGVMIKAPKGIAPVDPIVLGGRGRGVMMMAPKGVVAYHVQGAPVASRPIVRHHATAAKHAAWVQRKKLFAAWKRKIHAQAASHKAKQKRTAAHKMPVVSHGTNNNFMMLLAAGVLVWALAE